MIIASSLLTIIAVFLPWYTIDTIIESGTVYGFETDGLLTLGSGVLVLGIVYFRNQGRLETAVFSVLGIGTTLIGYYTFSQVSGTTGGGYGLASASPHVGVYVTMVAGALIFIGTMYGPIRNRA